MRKIIFSLILFIILSCTVFALDLSSEAVHAQNALNWGQANITEMIDAGFNIHRVNDTYTLAKEDFDAKLILEQKGVEVNYDSVIVKINEIKTVKDEAFTVHDELEALEIILEPLEDERNDLNETFALYDQAKQEFANERYEESLKMINECYDKLSEEQASQTTFRVFYETTSKTMKSFLINNWQKIIYAIVIISIILIITYKRVSIAMIKRKIGTLEMRKEVLKKLIVSVQKEYFEKGKLSETEYHIKISKFSEMIRDSERQIPLLKEQLAKRKRRDILKGIISK